jgi:hypothetical protein
MLPRDHNSVFKRCKEWRTNVNNDKCQSISFTNKIKNLYFHYYLGNYVIMSLKKVKKNVQLHSVGAWLHFLRLRRDINDLLYMRKILGGRPYCVNFITTIENPTPFKREHENFSTNNP